MVRKVFKRLTASMRSKPSEPAKSIPKTPGTPRVLTAEGWRRFMLKRRK